MCKVKSGVNIQNEEDIKNVITGLVFRQQKEYKEDYILGLLQLYLKGSSFAISPNRLMSIIDCNLDVLCRSGEIKCQGGYYYTKSI